MDYQRRIDAARASMAERGMDLLVVGHPANRQYLSGFAWNDESPSASAGWIVLTPDSGYFLTTTLYYDGIRDSLKHLEPVKAAGGITRSLLDLLKGDSARTIGFEGGWFNYLLYDEITKGLRPDQSLIAVDGLVEQLREIKDADELAVIREATEITDRAYTEIVAQIHPGQTEREIAWALERRMRELGAEGMAFGPSVAAGVHTAVPHHEGSDYRVKRGDPIWIDLGARVRGYDADLTRSFSLETASPDYLRMYDVVLRSQELALRGIKAGITGRKADALSRDLLAAEGFGDDFTHSLGHGVGLMIHEAPRLSRLSDDVLASGMVTSVEPGLYQVAWGGIRIEDLILVEESGNVVLSAAPKQPVVG